MTVQQVSDLLGRIVSGELDHDQIDHIRSFLMAGIDITALMV